MKLPNFLIVGGQKCGTTMLHNTLSKHPQIFMSDVKEINYFTIDNNYRKGLKEYSKHFKKSKKKHKAIGESSPGYMCYPGASERIKEDLGRIKIIMLLRDPIKRALSQYWDNRRHFNEELTFAETIKEYLEIEYNPDRKGYFSRGVYDQYLHNYLQVFPVENIYVSIFEEFISNSEKELNSITDFLGVEKFNSDVQLSENKNSSSIYQNLLYNFLLENPKIANKVPKRLRRLFFWGPKKPFKYPLPEEDILKRLRNFYKSTIINLEGFLEKDLALWKLSKEE